MNVAYPLRVAAHRLHNFLLIVAMHDYYNCIQGLLYYNTRTQYLPKEPLTNFRANLEEISGYIRAWL